MAHLADRERATCRQHQRGRMPQRKRTEDTRTQRQKFIDAAREHGADGDEDAFRRAVRKVAKASSGKASKAPKKGD